MTSSFSFKKMLSWLDQNILIVMAGFLLAFIPLYPKLPLFDILPGYIVRVRIEDFLILATAIVWLIQTFRGKVKWKTPVFWAMGIYAVVGILSSISAVFITQTVPLQVLHVGKTALHFFRYMEYFSMFPILYAAVESKKQVKILIAILAISLVGITVYGYGQRNFYWPVYSTMNREFSKGIRLYLTEHARVQSTFGGHYDLAAYLVIFLPFILAVAFQTPNKKAKLALFIIHWAGVWLIIESASRISFGAYIAGLGLVVLITALTKPGWKQKLSWMISRGLLVSILMVFMMAIFGSEIYQRFEQVLQGYPAVYRQYQTITSNSVKLVTETIPRALSINDLLHKPKVEKPANAVAADDPDQVEVAAVTNALVPSDERPVETKPARPSDVFVNVPETVQVASVSASGSAITVSVQKDRTFSDCALTKGLSECIRYETLWPLAIAGFKRNPLLGSGYATLTKNSVGEFTEAESTDNNFLRTLGETGILGFVTFYGIIVLINWLMFKSLTSEDWLAKALSIGFLAGSIGLLINASYIDVYASSKVAQSYWGLAGLVLAYAYLNQSVGGPLKISWLSMNKPTAIPAVNGLHIPEATKPRKRVTKKRTTHV